MLNDEKKRALLANLIKMARIDGEVSPTELIFVQTTALKMGITPDAFQSVVNGMDMITVPWGMEETEKWEQFYLLLSLMNIDFEAHEEEQRFCIDLGSRYGLPANKVRDAVDYMVSRSGEPVSREDFLTSIA